MTSFLDRLMGRAPIAKKAVYGGEVLPAYQNDVPLSVLAASSQEKMARYLQAYKVGWFYKAGHKIAGDIAGLSRTLAYEDTEGDNADEIVAPALNVPWEQLDALEQFLRLMERPNPYQTGRTLFTKTQIRLDFAGAAFWYLDNPNEMGLPTAIYGISPARMWPSVDTRGRLIGWVMDKNDRGGGTPFSTEEILPFLVPGVDEDTFSGQGVVEAVWSQVPLSGQIARHTSDVLTTGGRLAGMIWPKDRALDEDEYLDAQRAWRSVASDPNAARRMLIFPEPMEYASGAATPVEIGIPELATLSRDEILTAFPISPYQLGVPMPGGLNSAATRAEDRHDYWEVAIHPRVELLEETIQWGLINRYEEAVGRPLDFDIEEPNLDDAPAIVEKVGALKGLISTGFEPEEAIAAVGLDHIKWNGLPSDLNPFAQPVPVAAPPAANAGTAASVSDIPGDRARITQDVLSKAVRLGQAVKTRREDVMGRELSGFEGTMRGFLFDQRERIEKDVERTLGPLTKAQRKTAPEWWDQAREDKLLTEALNGLYVRLARSALQVVANEVDRFVYQERVARVTSKMLKDAGSRITGINETTRAAVADQIAEGIKRGYSIAQITSGVGHEDYPGIRNAAAFDEARAELVARTETMLGYNKSALFGYQEFDVGQVEAIDGDGDEECAQRDGQVFSVEEALDIEDHPNGTLDWIPLTDKAWHPNAEVLEALKALKAPQQVQVPMPVIHLHQAAQPLTVNLPETKAGDVVVNVPEQPAPIVHVAAAEAPTVEVSVEAPIVHVAGTEVKVPDVFVTVPDQPPAGVEVKVESDKEAQEAVVSALTDLSEAVVSLARDVAELKTNAPVINLPAPVVNVKAASVPRTTIQDVRIVDSTLPPKVRRVTKRDAAGRAIEVTDG